MSKHFTCDKCGYPMEFQNELTIGDKIYDICSSCTSEILKGLKNKGISLALKSFKDKFVDIGSLEKYR